MVANSARSVAADRPLVRPVAATLTVAEWTSLMSMSLNANVPVRSGVAVSSASSPMAPAVTPPATIVGRSLVPVTVTVIGWSKVAPEVSVRRTVKVSTRISPACRYSTAFGSTV